MKPKNPERTARPQGYQEQVLVSRKGKDAAFVEDPNSPLPAKDKAGFKGLNYFPVDMRYRIYAHLVRYRSPGRVTMASSKGTNKVFLDVGHFELTIGGIPVKLHAYQATPDDKQIFVPFRDATSGKESYGAARYIDLEREREDNYTIDFNLAYNPYCAYSEEYICPLPPRENWLAVPIRAGERSYH